MHTHAYIICDTRIMEHAQTKHTHICYIKHDHQFSACMHTCTPRDELCILFGMCSTFAVWYVTKSSNDIHGKKCMAEVRLLIFQGVESPSCFDFLWPVCIHTHACPLTHRHTAKRREGSVWPNLNIIRAQESSHRRALGVLFCDTVNESPEGARRDGEKKCKPM